MPKRHVTTGSSERAREKLFNHSSALTIALFRSRATLDAEGKADILGMTDYEAGLISLEEAEREWSLQGFGCMVLESEWKKTNKYLSGEASGEANPAEKIRLLIEPEEPSGSEGFFIPQKGDVFFVLIGEHDNPPRFAFEVAGVENWVNGYPLLPRFLCVRREDLDVLAGGQDPAGDRGLSVSRSALRYNDAGGFEDDEDDDVL